MLRSGLFVSTIDEEEFHSAESSRSSRPDHNGASHNHDRDEGDKAHQSRNNPENIASHEGDPYRDFYR